MLPKLVDTVTHPPRYVRLAAKGLLITGLVALLLPPLLRLLDPSYSTFSLDTLNAPAWGAVLLASIVHLGAYAYERLLPRFKTYQQDSLEVDGKFFENLTDELRLPLWEEGVEQKMRQWPVPDRIAFCTERRKTSQFQFLIRCVRTAFCLLSFYALLVLAKDVVLAILTVVPK